MHLCIGLKYHTCHYFIDFIKESQRFSYKPRLPVPTELKNIPFSPPIDGETRPSPLQVA